MPYESLEELKIIFNGDQNFQRMCEAAVRTKMVDVFLEEDDVNDDASHANETVGDASHATVGGNRDKMCEEEARIEENIAGFVDEEEECNDEDTPPNSDCDEEDGANGRKHYDKYINFSGEIRLEQTFDAITEFKEAIVDYVLKTRRNVKFTRWGSEKSEVRCTIGEGCPFRIYCSYEKPIKLFMAKFCNDEHSCDKDGFTKVVKDGVIAKLFLNDFRRNPDLMPQAMQQTLEDRYDLVVTHNQCRKAKGKALKMIQDEDDEQFARFRDYETELLRTNPESTIELGTVAGVEGVDLFDRFYPLEEMQTISSIQLLGAVVQVENTDNWVWFIAKLKADLGIGDGEGFTLIPDRQKGLLIVVDQELPKIEHRMCARHIYGNLTRVHPGRAIMRKIFWKIAKAYTVAEYDEGIEEMRQYVLGVYETLMEKNPQTCSRAYFTGTACYEVVHNNFSETYNNTINTAREMPLVEMLETIRRLAMVRTDFRKEKMKKHKGKYSKKVAKTIEEESKHKNNGRAVAGANGQFDVRENNLGHSGHMTRRTCSCRKWDMTGIPCRHALRVIMLHAYEVEI
ncbi:PREDICTED: uncharacterized protein LOC106314401 [Brassica oleracea var. oleracea]|uniref:uncharacterized protein LOC106314401 n=1 Tax=Brassica oleracea var. oleracea TaxID=109376 RepID=UPI0006A6A181|nr:PREDICTED: uncharacterized protein LOC106314401 [Brassica oleracea var. oleracea]